MDYMVRFNGHIVESKRPDGFPKVVHAHSFVEAPTKDALIEHVKREMAQFINVQGMGVSCDPSALQDASKVDTNRMFVPMHMIAYINADVFIIQGEVPLTDEEGKETLRSGKKVVLQ